MNNLISQVEQWSIDKDLHKANPDRQALKVWEESGEIAAALSRNDKEALMDGIGDTVVTLIILAQQHDMTLERCLQYAYDEIKGRTGKTINGTFVKSEDLPQDEKEETKGDDWSLSDESHIAKFDDEVHP